jgi:hypothetical protein
MRSDYVAPSTDVEVALARIWREALGLERVGMNDNFFALGGDSIAATRAISKAMAEGLRIDLIFQRPTIRELAAVISAGRAVGDAIVMDDSATVSRLHSLLFNAMLIVTFATFVVWAMYAQ